MKRQRQISYRNGTPGYFTRFGVWKTLSAKPSNTVRRERDQVMRDIGMVKVRGALGGAYWE